MRLRDTRQGRLGLTLRLGLLLWAAAFACLNPRPDDQPLVVGDAVDIAPSPGSGAPPSTENPLGDGNGEQLPSSPGNSSNGPTLGADAGAPDAGPQDDTDASALDE